MKFTPEKRTAKQLFDAWSSGSLVRNPEYQRGEAWKTVQRQVFIDSLFRDYPVPPLFIQRLTNQGLFEDTATRYEVIDGQQRILAIYAFMNNEFPLLETNDKKLRLPLSLRQHQKPWGGLTFSKLPTDLRTNISEHPLDIYLVEEVDHGDEVRDLFIRLQSGTALTRQQVRDAWPGNIGPWIVQLAGKFKSGPKYRLFSAIDRRGMRDDSPDTEDQHEKHRQTCAQLLRILIARISDPAYVPSVKASDLDAFYHEQTAFNIDCDSAKEIESVFVKVQQITDNMGKANWGRKKPSKMEVFALCMFIQDMQRNSNFRFDTQASEILAKYSHARSASGRTVSGSDIKKYYIDWRSGLPDHIGKYLDESRLFSEPQRREIWERAAGKCAMCNRDVHEDDAEYDHILPHFLGGPTEVSNGRLVHERCHFRGSPSYLEKLYSDEPSEVEAS